MGIAGSSVQTIERLYLASPDTLLSAVRNNGETARRILLVAHNPGLEQLAMQFGAPVPFMQPASLVHFTQSGDWQTLSSASARFEQRMGMAQGASPEFQR